MLSYKQIWDSGQTGGGDFDGRILWILCLACGTTLTSCCDPACEDEMHHNETDAEPSFCPLGFSVFYSDSLNYITLSYADANEAQAEADAYRAYKSWARDYFGTAA